jgi:UDP-N-acetylglucosamine--N-acetylmuramyl-(pentapeptide) pyrophosphoryl-undecaprenol N-acetylglucosamine transferase
VVETGNPVRWQKLPQVPKGEKFSLLVFGGSAGARRINFAFVDALKRLVDLAGAMRVTHQTGQADYAAIKDAYAALPFDAAVTPFIDKMDEVYAKADLVVCRSGATTVAELTAFGKAAILVPYPYAIYDHQRGNAQALQDRGAADMILDQELTGEALAARIRAYFSDRERLERMAGAARALGRPEAAARIVEECYALARG